MSETESIKNIQLQNYSYANYSDHVFVQKYVDPRGKNIKAFWLQPLTKAQMMNSEQPQNSSSIYLSASSYSRLEMEMAVYVQSLKHFLYTNTIISVRPWNNYSSMRIFPNSRDHLEEITTVLKLI